MFLSTSSSMRATNVPVRASCRAREAALGQAAVERDRRSPEIGEPQPRGHGVEQQRDDERDRQVHAGGDPQSDHENDEDGVLAVVERVAETHRGRDAAQPEREGDAVFHQHDDARDDDGHDHQQLHDGLLIAAPRARERVDPRDGKRERERRDHRQDDGHGERLLIRRGNQRCVLARLADDLPARAQQRIERVAADESRVRQIAPGQEAERDDAHVVNSNADENSCGGRRG